MSFIALQTVATNYCTKFSLIYLFIEWGLLHTESESCLCIKNCYLWWCASVWPQTTDQHVSSRGDLHWQVPEHSSTRSQLWNSAGVGRFRTIKMSALVSIRQKILVVYSFSVNGWFKLQKCKTILYHTTLLLSDHQCTDTTNERNW